MLRGLRTGMYPARDLAASKAFYAALTGVAPYFDEPFYVGFDIGGYELGLIPDGEPGATGCMPLWGVDDIAAAVARLRELGAPIVEEPHEVGGGIRVATALDPAGNRLGLIFNPHFRAEVGARVAATGETMSQRTIVLETTVPLSQAEVWKLWTTEGELRTWFGNDCRVELRVGGPFEIYFLKEPGMRGSEGCRILSFLPPRLLTFTWNAPPGMKTRWDNTWVIVELEPVDGETRVRLTHTGWPEASLTDGPSDWPATFDYFRDAWAGVLASLTDRCRRKELPDRGT
jgi:uncharacterized protein YndB with AHSA1/START domain/predicted enzyme related to lactoylglutathione lyase